MNVTELIARLQEIAEEYPDAEVQMAVQPSYPIAETILGVVGPDEELDAMEDKDESDMEYDGKVWLVSGGQGDEPYAPRWVFSAASH